MHYIGIDPGLTGAIAIVSCLGEFIHLFDMPTITKGKGKGVVKNQVNAAQLAFLLNPFGGFGVTAVLEQVSTRPGQGIATNGSLMHSLGVTEGVLGALGFPVIKVAPASWKRHFGLIGAEKDAGRTVAQDRFPGANLARKKDIGRADALLIALYGFQKEGRQVA